VVNAKQQHLTNTKSKFLQPLTSGVQNYERLGTFFVDKCPAIVSHMFQGKSLLALARTVALATLILCSISAHAAVYYVSTQGSNDSGTGTISKPWRTIGKGLHEMGRGDTLYIRGGVYREPPIETRQLKDGLDNKRRTVIASYPGERAIFRPNTGTGHGVSASSGRNGPHYMTFEGWTIDMSLKKNFDHSFANLKFYTASHITFSNMHFINNVNGSLTQIFPNPKIGVGGGMHVINCVFSNVHKKPRSDGKMPSDVHPIYWTHSPGTIIENCVFEDGHSTGLLLTSSNKDWIVRNNLISDFHYGLYVRGRDSLFYNNVILSPAHVGIRARGIKNVYANNKVIGAVDSGAEYGIEDHYSVSGSLTSTKEVFMENVAWGNFDRGALIFRKSSRTRTSYWTNNVGSSLEFTRGAVLEGNLANPEYDPLM
jgi:hypothetical protein